MGFIKQWRVIYVAKRADAVVTPSSGNVFTDQCAAAGHSRPYSMRSLHTYLE